MGLAVREVPPLTVGEEPVSSSRIRAQIQAGKVAEAMHLLGRPYGVEGVVREGRKLARTLGVPTANLPWPQDKARPPAGSYAGWAYVPSPTPALLYLPPEGDLEVHLLGEEKSLYGETLKAAFLEQIRLYRPFSDLREAQEWIHRDVEAARAYFRSRV
uniref:riboflavin kinase n=1 Tax=uncultured Bacteroidota bacterium TaxID=152509 RepID=H5SMS0_9BACT|nr:riboflavin kinase/FMN adenylyltransferase [uncultured Bacteroidetes bacterium]